MTKLPNTFCLLFLILLLCMFFVSISETFADSCPPKDKVQKAVKNTFHRPIEVIDIKPAQMPGLCQVQVQFQKQKRLIYCDTAGDFLVAGQLFSTKDGKNLTRETMMEINRLSKEEVKKLDQLTAFTVGDKGPVIYFVTDPQCPYCKKAETILEPLARQGKVQAKFLLFPLKFHKGAKEESISIICDKKGLEGLKNRYRSENQCEDGKKKVETTVSFLMGKGITGTPTYIFPDGRYHSGVMDKKGLEKKLAEIK